MGEADQLVTYVNCWNRVEFRSWIPNAVDATSFPAPQFVLIASEQPFVTLHLEQSPLVNAVNYVHHHNSEDEQVIRRALDAFNLLFDCEPSQIIEFFADYLCEPNADWLRNRARQEPVSSSAVYLVPPDRQVRIEAAAKDHVVHLETITLAEEQEAPTASAVGQILISGREVWMRWKRKLLHSLSRSLRNRSSVGFQIALESAVQASFC